jgi:hypothetical protein
MDVHSKKVCLPDIALIFLGEMITYARAKQRNKTWAQFWLYSYESCLVYWVYYLGHAVTLMKKIQVSMEVSGSC